MKIIGLCGKAGAGKDTAGEFILEWCRRNGFTAERVAFADPLKVSAARSLGFNGATEDCVAFCNELKVSGCLSWSSERDDKPSGLPTVHTITGREFLQLFGTEAHRDVFGQEFWVEQTEKRLAEMSGAVDVVVLTDCRFDNEAKMIRRHEGEVWEVVWPELPESTDEHVSEAGLPDGAIEFQIINDFPRGPDGLREFQELVEKVCESNLR
ncbi:MAG TPA: hypothetical protein VFY10_06795 [Dehalococcoidia bacterium]|nr:hypothetical protein [Dehalococcoidia bacterium]